MMNISKEVLLIELLFLHWMMMVMLQMQTDIFEELGKSIHISPDSQIKAALDMTQL